MIHIISLTTNNYHFSYIEFQKEQKAIVKNYTHAIENELKKYEDNVLKYFGLIRHKPEVSDEPSYHYLKELIIFSISTTVILS